MAESGMARGLSERESRLLSSLAAKGKYLFTISEAQQVLGSDAPYAANILYRLTTKRWLQRIERGKYRLIPLEAGPEAQWAEHEFRIAATLASPYYLAYATALAYYGYTERALNPIWIATTHPRKPLMLDGITYRFVSLNVRKFFGFTNIQVMDTPITIAEPEKALADGFDHPEYCGGVIEAAKGLWYGRDEIDREHLIAYSCRLANYSALKRLGFWWEQLCIVEPGILEELTRKDHNYPLLDPTGPRQGRVDRRWRLIVNIPEEQLLEWREN
ncbi:MAG: type IV toxin-antitoxin system AbiEi family antitoxin domain-containing protein [Anaerolineae bacterium]